MLNIAVLLGGSSSEREVSLKSGQAVIDALDTSRYNVFALDPSKDLPQLLELAPRLDAALVMLHGRGGEDGAMQGMLDLLNIPYQCSGVLGCAVAMNKTLSKDIFRLNKLPVAADFVLHKEQKKHAAQLLPACLGWPVVVKPSNEGSSFGITIVNTPSSLDKALEQAFALDDEVLIEEFIDGVELTAGVIGNQNPEPLPLIEIIPPQGEFFDYEAKYIAGRSQEICPARISPEHTALIQDLAVKAHNALRLNGYSRSDFILNKEKGPFILETNTVPGMTNNSLLPLAARTAGMDFPSLVDKLIDLALARKK